MIQRLDIIKKNTHQQTKIGKLINPENSEGSWAKFGNSVQKFHRQLFGTSSESLASQSRRTRQ